MRQHGRATISPSNPSALGVCDACGFLYNLNQLVWNYDWRGPRIQNLRTLVCQSCQDDPQPNGQRTIILPQDPVPVMNARPEMYVSDDNPMSAIGAYPTAEGWQYGNRIGTMSNYGSVPAAFDGVTNKPLARSAVISVSNSSYNNYVGINWAGRMQALTMPSSLLPPVITHTVTAFSMTAPNDSTFGSSAFVVQGSPVDAGWGSWTTIYTGTTAGTVGETVSGDCSGGQYQFHRIAFLGNGGGQIAVAQVEFTVAEIG